MKLNRLFVLILFLIIPLQNISSQNTISFEYIPVYASFAMGGGGIGLGYEAEVNDFFSIHPNAVFGYFPAENSGAILVAGASADAVFSPFSKLRALKLSAGGGVHYIGAIGESINNELEGHFIVPNFNTSAGWRFIIGDNRVQFIIEPELVFSMLFPGPAGSGFSGNLEWHSTGYFMGVLYPNLIFGVKF